MAKRYDDNFIACIQWLLNHKFKLMQNLKEIYWLYSLIKQMDPKPKVFVEIGSLEGGSAFILSKAMPKDSIIISIDPAKLEQRDLAFKFIKLRGQKAHQIKMKSEDPQAMESLKSLLKSYGGSIDVLFIDGSHEYKAAKFDYENYSPLVKKGLVAMHDISLGCRNHIRVHELWAEIKQKERNCRENVNPAKIRGIGVVFK